MGQRPKARRARPNSNVCSLHLTLWTLVTSVPRSMEMASVAELRSATGSFKKPSRGGPRVCLWRPTPPCFVVVGHDRQVLVSPPVGDLVHPDAVQAVEAGGIEMLRPPRARRGPTSPPTSSASGSTPWSCRCAAPATPPCPRSRRCAEPQASPKGTAWVRTFPQPRQSTPATSASNRSGAHVQVPPAPPGAVITGAGPAPTWAAQTRPPGPYPDHHPLVGDAHRLHVGAGQTQYPG
jgi:hypothetical protein